ncbi:rsmE, partial [Symbiodinium natans]
MATRCELASSAGERMTTRPSGGSGRLALGRDGAPSPWAHGPRAWRWRTSRMPSRIRELLKPPQLNAVKTDSTSYKELPEFLELQLSAPSEQLPWPAPPPQVDLLLVPPAFDRFQRLLPQLAQLGLGRIYLCKVPGGPRVFGCHLLRSPELLRAELLKGLEQCGDTQVPEVLQCNLRSCLEELADDSLRLMAERGPSAPLPLPPTLGRCILAVGPEAGWREEEEALLKEAGFQGLCLGVRPLTTELQVFAGVALADAV